MSDRRGSINLMLVFVLFFSALGITSTNVQANSGALLPGDIAVILMNTDNPDTIAFVALSDLAAGEEIIFTDSGWYAAGGFRATEGAVRYTVPSGGLPAGTIVSKADPFTSENWDVPSGIGFSGDLLFSASGDQVIVFQGNTTTYSMVYAVNDEGAGVWQADATSSNTSALPTGLIDGTTAVAVAEQDNIRLNCAENHSGTKTELLDYISNSANWVGDNSNPQSVDPNCSFTLTSGPAPLKINEFVVDHGGSTDDSEFVEVFGEPETDYSDHTILQIEGDSTGAGVIDTVLSVGTTDANGIWWSGYYDNEFENGTITLLLVKNFTGSDGDDLDTDNDGTLDTFPWDEIVDSVSLPDGGTSDRTYGLPELPPNYDGNSYQPGGASRIPDGYDTETDTDWVRNAFYSTGLPGAGEAYNTPGELNSANACGGAYTPIYDIQGSGDITPFDGTDVVTEGIVVGDFQTNGKVDGSKNGFYIQDMTGDGDTSTSDGIFIYYYASDVQVGDYVRVTGEAYEYSDVTQLGYIDSLIVCDVSQPLPAPTVVSLPVADKADLEMLEGMRVLFPQDLVVSEYYNFDRYGEIVLATQKYIQYTAMNEPDVAGYAAAEEEFELNSITLDDGRTGQNPDPAIHPNGLEFDLYNRFRGGDLVTNLTGIMDYGFGFWRIQPTEGADYTPANPRTAAPDILNGDIKVASLNVYNYFTTLDNDPYENYDQPSDLCGPAGGMDCRGADFPEELTRQRAKIIAALATIDADIVGLMEIENDRLGATSPDYAVADLVDGLNVMVGADTYDYIATGAIGSDAIKVAMIYKPGNVTPVGDYAILDSSVDARFLDDYNRPVLAQSFVDNLVGETITVAVNHLKSKGSPCDAVDDPDTGDGQGNCNLTRLAAAQAEVDWLEDLSLACGSKHILIIGDLNAYDKEDPIDAIKLGPDDLPGTGDDFFDLIFQVQGEDAYSYVFDGRFGYLDYAMANASLMPFVTDATVWHINADEPDLLDYDTSFKQPAQDAIYAPDAYRASDHDPVVVTLTFNQPPVVGDDAYETDQDVTLNVAAPGVLANDLDINEFDEITLEVLTPPEHGALTLNQDGSFSYIPDHKFFGEDSFVYRMYALPPSRAAFSNDATVTITVHPAVQYFFPIAYKR